MRNPSIAPERKATGVPCGRSASAFTGFQAPFSTSAWAGPGATGFGTNRWSPTAAATPAAIPAAPVSNNDRRLGRAAGCGRADCSPTHSPIDPCIRARNSFDGKPAPGLPSKEFLARMQGSIGEWVGEQSARPQPAARPSRRSLLLTGAAGIAAGVAAAVGLQRFVPKPVAPGPAQALVEKG